MRNLVISVRDKKGRIVYNKVGTVHNKGTIVCRNLNDWLDTMWGTFEKEKTMPSLQQSEVTFGRILLQH